MLFGRTDGKLGSDLFVIIIKCVLRDCRRRHTLVLVNVHDFLGDLLLLRRAHLSGAFSSPADIINVTVRVYRYSVYVAR